MPDASGAGRRGRARPAPGGLRRLFAPQRLAVVGGVAAEQALVASRALGFAGEIWPVHPRRTTMGGVPCFPDVASLPGPPDAAFVSVRRTETVRVVGELARAGAGGVVCHASGFAEDGETGARLQAELVAAAGTMPLLGPNCLGVLNYLDGAALWADQHGGRRVDAGVAIVAQSGNIGLNLTMQRRGLPVAALVTLGNQAATDVPDVLQAMLEDPRVTAVGLHLESLPDPVALARAGVEALRRGVPVVVLKAGGSELGARVALSHTSSLAGADVVGDALFRRLGFARVHDLGTFLSALTLLHVHGALPGVAITSASCSGGEAAHVADLAERHGVHLPDLTPYAGERLRAVLGERVSVRNPLDYHTYVWGQRDALVETFTALLTSTADAHLLVLDTPQEDRADPASWRTTVDALVTAQQVTGARAAVVSSLPEGMPEQLAGELVAAGVAPLVGIGDALAAVVAAGLVGAAQRSVHAWVAPDPPDRCVPGAAVLLDEAQAKEVLRAAGVDVPPGIVADGAGTGAAADALGYPVVLKTLSDTVAHKSDVGGVVVGLADRDAVLHATERMRVTAAGPGRRVGDRFLVESMVIEGVVELVVAVRPTEAGQVLTVGAGGVLVELLQDTATVLLPTSRSDLLRALQELRVWPALAGHRGRSIDPGAVLTAVLRVADCARGLGDRLVELEVNPLIATPTRAVAVDALLRVVAAHEREGAP